MLKMRHRISLAMFCHGCSLILVKVRYEIETEMLPIKMTSFCENLNHEEIERDQKIVSICAVPPIILLGRVGALTPFGSPIC
jgi:hypothetical protein